MKYVLIMSLILGALAFAEGDAKAEKGQNWTEKKAKIVEHLDKKAAVEKQYRDCVAAAADQSAFKECRKKHQDGMKPLKEGRKDFMKKHRDKFKNWKNKNKSKKEASTTEESE